MNGSAPRLHSFFRLSIVLCVLAASPPLKSEEPVQPPRDGGVSAGESPLGYRVALSAACHGYDRRTCWVHARAGAVPEGGKDGRTAVVMVMQKLLLSRSDVFSTPHQMLTDDLGTTWHGPVEIATLSRTRLDDGTEVCPANFALAWHRTSGKLLAIADLLRYHEDRITTRPKGILHSVYSVYDAESRSWSRWAQMETAGKLTGSAGGCAQRVELDDGTILMPVHCGSSGAEGARVTVLRCSFDGTTLRGLEHGDLLFLGRRDNDKRPPHEGPEPGLYEPSLTRYRGRFYLTMRHEFCGAVTRSEDGLHYEPIRPWEFDDGTELGNYKTQQHWVTHREGLFLVYTRRGADNNHVFRHRAPLFIALVDPERLCLIRATERVLVPNRGARLGNFGVCDVNERETWVTAAEWMQSAAPHWYEPARCERHGSDNSVFVARIIWDRPNRRP